MDSPQSSTPPPDEITTSQVESDTKPCPYCGEMLKAAAFVCRFCRRDLYAPNAPPIILSPTDWEIARPPSMVSEFVRMESAKLPVSQPVWTVMCLGLTSLISLLCINLARLPDPPKRPRQTQQSEEWRPRSTPTPAATPEPNGAAQTPTLEFTQPEPAVLVAPTPDTTAPPPSQPEPMPQPAPTLSEAEKAHENAKANSIRVTSVVLVATFLATPSAAEDEYTNHYLYVSGPVLSSGKNENGVPFVVLRGGNNVSVRCIFAKSVKEVPPIEAGGIMHVYGICDGKFIDVRLSECTPG